MSPAIFLYLMLGMAFIIEQPNLIAETPLNSQQTASPSKKTNQRAHDGRIEFSYLYHNPATKVDLIKEIAALEEISSYKDFFIALFKTHQNQAVKWLEEAHVKPENHPALINALWAGGLASEAIFYAQKAGWPAKSIMELTEPAKPALKISAEYFAYLPSIRCHFCMTGNTRYIDKIIDIFDLTPERVSPSFNLEELKNEAEYQLMVLMYYHEVVHRHCLKQAKTCTGKSKRILDTLLEQYTTLAKNGSFPNCNGLLNGDLLITDSPSFEEEWETLPVNSGPIGEAICTIPYPEAQRCDIKIVPLFSGFSLDEELNGHVTYDIEVYDPEGACICSCKERLGLQRRIPSRLLVQAAEELVHFKFNVSEENSEGIHLDAFQIKPGIYKIQGIIRDHIGNTELKVTKTLEILPPPN